MSRQIRWTPRARKDLRKLDQPIQRRIVAAIERLAQNAEGDVRRLKDVRPPEWRLRVGDWRLRFRLDPAGTAIKVIRVLRRDKAY